MKQSKLQMQGILTSQSGAATPVNAQGLKRKCRDSSQPFARLVVLDFEATCDQNKDLHPQVIHFQRSHVHMGDLS